MHPSCTKSTPVAKITVAHFHREIKIIRHANLPICLFLFFLLPNWMKMVVSCHVYMFFLVKGNTVLRAIYFYCIAPLKYINLSVINSGVDITNVNTSHTNSNDSQSENHFYSPAVKELSSCVVVTTPTPGDFSIGLKAFLALPGMYRKQFLGHNPTIFSF